MEKYDVKFKKKYGQNFLNNLNVVNRIVDQADIDLKSLVIEVGPGGGIMTKELAKKAKNVLAYEIDRDLACEIHSRLDEFDNVLVLFQDFLLSDIKRDIADFDYEKLFFISNVPYYITTPILLKLINSNLYFNKIVMMVQKEVGERFSTKSGSREYGSITVLLNYFYDVKKEFNVSRNNFVPVPNVDSVVISFTEKKDKKELIDFNYFEQLVRDSFKYKRKTIKNNLKNYDLEVVSKVLDKYGFDLSVRAEMLDVDVFVDLANNLRK